MSQLYTPYKALGLITDGNPIQLNTLGGENFLTTSIGKAFQVFRADKLTVAVVGPQLPRRVRALATSRQGRGAVTFVASGNEIVVFERTRIIATLRGHVGVVDFLLALAGGSVLISICRERELRVWNTTKDALLGANAGEVKEEGVCVTAFVRSIRLPETFTTSVVVHPDTYLNKILVGSEEGRLELWNIRTGALVHAFKDFTKQNKNKKRAKVLAEPEDDVSSSMSSRPGITAIEQSPALDVVACGTESGQVVLLNLKFDEVLFRFQHEVGMGGVTRLAFRTDAASAQVPLLASGCSDGQIALWDLSKRRLHTTVRDAHQGMPVTSLIFLPGEPVLVSAGADNALRMWIFDQEDGTPRLLKSREGHKAPPRHIRYYPSGGNTTLASILDGSDGTCCQILSAGLDRAFRVFHTVRAQQSRELSQGNVLKRAKQMALPVDELKLRPITAFASCETRSRDWCNVATAHEGEANVYVWSFKSRAIGKHVLRQSHWPANSMSGTVSAKHLAASVAISACGNFCLVGTKGGVVYKYNLQSGKPRGRYPKLDTRGATVGATFRNGVPMPGTVGSVVREAEKTFGIKVHKASAAEQRALNAEGHTDTVTGLVIDALNRVVASGGLDGTIRFWGFLTHRLLDEPFAVGSGVSHMEIARDVGLLAAACDDFVVRIFDVHTRRLVRRLNHAGCSGITDMCFSNDARRLLSASNDSSVRVWDIPEGRTVDWMQFRKPVTGLTVSPTGEFLATAHADTVNINLWADRSFFSSVFLDNPPERPCLMDDPSPAAAAAMVAAATSGQREEGDDEEEGGGGDRDGDGDGGAESGGPERVNVPPLAEGAVTLSTLPRAHWETLFNLEVIKQRNKPKQPPKAPEQAPFFLPTVRKDGTVDPFFAPPAADASKKRSRSGDENDGDNGANLEGWGAWTDADGIEEEEEEEEEEAFGGSRLLHKRNHPVAAMARCRFASLLDEAQGGGDSESRMRRITEYLSGLAASAVDVQFRCLCDGVHDGEGLRLVTLALQYLTAELATRRNFEVLQAYTHRFLTIHSDAVSQTLTTNRRQGGGEESDEEGGDGGGDGDGGADAVAAALHTAVQGLRDVQRDCSGHVKEMLQHSLCLLQFFSNVR